MRFTRHYAFSTCAPSRAALLTGLHPSRLGFRPRGRGISGDVHTLADRLRQAGYATHHVGKWHLGTEPEAMPGRQGFAKWFGFLEASDLGRRGPTYRDPWLRTGEAPPERHRGHLTDLLADHAVSIVTSHAEASQPWFLNLWLLAPHWPIQPASRFAVRHPDSAQGRYAALLEQLDEAVGRVLSAVEESGQARRTLVVFASDNGGTNRDAPNNRPFAGRKNTYGEGALRTPLVLRWPGAHVRGGSIDAPVTILDLVPTLAAAAGVPVGSEVDGRDLRPLLRGEELAGVDLFWEQYVPLPPERAGSEGRYVYSVLSADGRHRLVRSGGGRRLLDLELDETGGPGAEVERPEIAAELERRYRRWHGEARTLRVDRDRASGSVSGGPFQIGGRFGGFTFAAELRPEAGPAPASETIASRPGGFEILHHPERGIVARIGEAELHGPRLSRGRCSSIALASHFHRSLMHPADDYAVAELFVNGTPVASGRFAPGEPAPPSEVLVVGRGAEGSGPFRGEIGRIALVNERVERPGAPFTPAASELVSGWCVD